MITFEQSDEIAKWASEHADELRRDAARSSPEAVRSMLSWLGKHPLLRRYVQHLRTIRKNTEPWCALGERLYAALMLLAAESDGSDGAARLGDGWVPGAAPGYAMLAAVGSVPYLWLNTVDELVRQTPLPQHTVSRTCLPYPCLFFSFETCFGNPATGETNWLLVKHQPDGIVVVADHCVGSPPTVTINAAFVRYGSVWPDEYPNETEREGVGLVLRRLAFINSPYTQTETHRLPRPARREMARAGFLSKESPDPLVYTVQLRRAVADRSTNAAEDQAGDWKHHWWVSGHFRAQWYSSEQAHRVIWVAPYVKGNLAAPLLEKVYAVAR